MSCRCCTSAPPVRLLIDARRLTLLLTASLTPSLGASGAVIALTAYLVALNPDARMSLVLVPPEWLSSRSVCWLRGSTCPLTLQAAARWACSSLALSLWQA